MDDLFGLLFREYAFYNKMQTMAYLLYLGLFA
jgi:hypothetical protein